MAGVWEATGGVFWSSAPLLPSLDFVRDFGWFSFFMTLAATLVGAFAGAWAAQRNNEKTKTVEFLKKEIQVSNRGIMLTLSSFNVALAIKKQYVKDLKEQYESELKRLDNYRKEHPRPSEPFETILMLHQLQTMNFPIEALQNVIMDQSSDKALRALTSLGEAIELLNSAITRRNELIESFKAGAIPRDYTLDAMYFGLPVNGNTNREYGSTIDGIFLYNNDVIFYSLKLCEYLRENALKAAANYKKITRSKASVCEFDVSEAIDNGLIPDDPEHRKWEAAFVDSADETLPDKKWHVFKRRRATASTDEHQT
ncbi:hypothetical protein [Pseudomonas sichuanensis]|uniref:hypothetical protein n=1 Tax=Pseudomonas sichuanensis TaxID=2213015 RepID=UPI002ABAA609|nr:hypothetical protein [Pseudomonas sichuanensis]MDZ4021882.1 hypothetical protein [Pseudomonas sichuanensis]